jgi:hypothetical protein
VSKISITFTVAARPASFQWLAARIFSLIETFFRDSDNITLRQKMTIVFPSPAARKKRIFPRKKFV